MSAKFGFIGAGALSSVVINAFVEKGEIEKEVSIYNSNNELVLNRNNVCDCDEIVEEYSETTNYCYEEYDKIVHIVLNEV